MSDERIFFELILPVGCSVTVFVLTLLLVSAFFSSLARALRRVSPHNRRMEPGQVWLNLIPIFNLIWATVTVERIAESLRNEFRERGLHRPGTRYGRGPGLVMLVLLVPGVWFYPAFLCYPIAFCFWITYWIQVNGYAAELKPGAYTPPPMDDEGW